MNAIIFGVNSQDGYYLKEYCHSLNLGVTGVSRSNGDWVKGDVADLNFVANLVQTIRPDYVFHLAANSTTRHTALFENHQTISTGTFNILESVKLHAPKCRVFITGSGVQFENTGLPINEQTPFAANNAYAVSRIQSVYAARYYRELGIKAYVGYLFHHESPRRKAHHMSQFIASSIKKIAAGELETLSIGDVSVKKEWAYAKDIAEGIFTLTNQDQVFEATIGTGETYSIQDWVEECAAIAGLDWRNFLQTNEQSFNAEYSMLVSDPSTMRSIGWKPKTSFKELAQIMMAI
ncbi:MAG TPA: GDP-mannose 4,6-dehydratase [Phnomibacter sp.]|nr:GDP-mannose 4,6-dehydratase [Phnomibacter sp.]